MNITSWLRKEDSGLARTTLEIAKATNALGHPVCIRQPQDGMPIWQPSEEVDIHCIHSQLHPSFYHDGRPKVAWLHGEALSSVGNGISMTALIDLAPLCQAFIGMRRQEEQIWGPIKKTHIVPKGVDLDYYAPAEGPVERLSGEPAILYYENFRGSRNPLYIILGMLEVYKKFPKSRLHIYNVRDQKMLNTFKALIQHCKFGLFVRSLQGPVNDVPELVNKVDIVVSALYPLAARTPYEALACGKAAICMGYDEPNYPFQVKEYSPQGFADALIECWENYDSIDYRAWAEKNHDSKEMARQAIEIYEKYA